jgi:hypothetical protein
MAKIKLKCQKCDRENQVGLKDIEYELRKSKYKLKKYEDNT